MLTWRRGRESQLMCGMIGICQSPGGKKVGGVLAPAAYDDDVPGFQGWVVSESGAHCIAYYFGLAISSVAVVHFNGWQLCVAGIRSALGRADGRRCPPCGSSRAHPVKGSPRIRATDAMIEMDDGDIVRRR